METRLSPLITVKGLSLSTDDNTGKVENLDQNMFCSLKLTKEKELMRQNSNLDQYELCNFH